MTVLRIAFEFMLAPVMRIQDALKPTIIKQREHGRIKLFRSQGLHIHTLQY